MSDRPRTRSTTHDLKEASSRMSSLSRAAPTPENGEDTHLESTGALVPETTRPTHAGAIAISVSPCLRSGSATFTCARSGLGSFEQQNCKDRSHHSPNHPLPLRLRHSDPLAKHLLGLRREHRCTTKDPPPADRHTRTSNEMKGRRASAKPM